MAIYAVPGDKILILNQEDGEKLLRDIKASSMSVEERERIRKKVKKLRQKPEKNNV